MVRMGRGRTCQNGRKRAEGTEIDEICLNPMR